MPRERSQVDTLRREIQDELGYSVHVPEYLESIELAGEQSATVSQSHGEIRLVDWDVKIIDLGSANGTFLWDRETEQWQQLPPHEPVRLVNGTAIAVARRTFVYESTTGVEVPA